MFYLTVILPLGMNPAPLHVGQVDPLLPDLKSNTDGFHLNPAIVVPQVPATVPWELLVLEEGVLCAKLVKVLSPLTNDAEGTALDPSRSSRSDITLLIFSGL